MRRIAGWSRERPPRFEWGLRIIVVVAANVALLVALTACCAGGMSVYATKDPPGTRYAVYGGWPEGAPGGGVVKSCGVKSSLEEIPAGGVKLTAEFDSRDKAEKAGCELRVDCEVLYSGPCRVTCR
jgi:hypothetical protein